MQNIDASGQRAHALAARAVKLVVPETATQVNLSSALKPRRLDDMKSDLWTVFNRIQESSLRGGIKYESPKYDEQGMFQGLKLNTTRAIKSIPRQVEVNQGLWDIAAEFASEVVNG
jgi:hypothetical protein